MDLPLSRRRFLQAGAAAGVAAWTSKPGVAAPHDGIPTGPRAVQDATVTVLNPRERVPLSFIIDDSTCLVNLGHFCMPQFAECYPDRVDYQQPWWTWPREIPDAFVRRFGEWCAAQGVKGKYSIVPYPACVGWLDRELPGWSRRQLQQSLDLVRTLMLPNWDIHPEMITHTRVIDLSTGRPFDEISPATMENSYPQSAQSVDELASYLAYALRILHNCDLPCEGITTPGGFGNRVKPELSQAVFEAVRDVYGCELPHYFKYVVGAGESAQPKLEHVQGLGTDDVRATINVVAGTGDWFGGWEGTQTSEPDRYCTADASAGRMVDLIRAGEPAVFLCHWAGMYCNGQETGFQAFQRVVTSLNSAFGEQTIWMKLTEIARYWGAKGLTTIAREGSTVTLDAPFACPGFTLRVDSAGIGAPQVLSPDGVVVVTEAMHRPEVAAGRWRRDGKSTVVCWDLRKGRTVVQLQSSD